jgi:hypothetical protein
MGAPGKIVRTFAPDEAAALLKSAEVYRDKARLYREGLRPLER